jgi:mono/diheme cytochrome c family protein
MTRLSFALALSSVLAFGCGSSSSSHDSSVLGDSAAGDGSAPDTASGADAGSADTGAGSDAAADSGTDVAMSDGPSGDGGSSAAVTQGKYLVGVLGCANCHTPKVTGTMMPDMTMALAGVDCFVSTPGCLSSANLTPDVDTGLGAFTDQAIVDALRTGKEPDPKDAGKFLSSRMPYYQFANLNDADAMAIVAYLRSLPAVKHAVKEPTAPFDQAPTAAEWTPVDPAKLPAPGAMAPADAATGKYLASIACVTCHSPAATGTPKHVDETTAFQGGQAATVTSMGMMVMFESANLTPDMTGLSGWTAAEVVTAIKTAKDRMGKTLCAPMRANAAISDADATAIAHYLLSIPAVAHKVTACSARM